MGSLETVFQYYLKNHKWGFLSTEDSYKDFSLKETRYLFSVENQVSSL